MANLSISNGFGWCKKLKKLKKNLQGGWKRTTGGKKRRERETEKHREDQHSWYLHNVSLQGWKKCIHLNNREWFDDLDQKTQKQTQYGTIVLSLRPIYLTGLWFLEKDQAFFFSIESILRNKHVPNKITKKFSLQQPDFP